MKELELNFSDMEIDTDSELRLDQPNVQPVQVQPVPAMAHIPQHLTALESRLDDFSVLVLDKNDKATGTLVFWEDRDSTNLVVAKSSLVKSEDVTIRRDQAIAVDDSSDSEDASIPGYPGHSHRERHRQRLGPD